MDRLLAGLRQDPSDRARLATVSRFLQELDFEPTDASEGDVQALEELLGILLAQDFPIHAVVAKLAVVLVKRRHGIAPDAGPDNSPAQLDALASDALFQATMRRSINTDVGFERFLRTLRRTLLMANERAAARAERPLQLLTAMVEQCFNNEYVFYEDEDESRVVQALETRLLQELVPDRVSACEIDLLVLGMYRPLALGPLSQRLAAMPMQAFSQALRATLTRIVAEPLEEERLMAQLPALGELGRSSSIVVRSQYEDNPYPRWFNLGHSRSLADELRRRDPDFSWPTSFPEAELQILVPGCGSGQHPLSIAAANPHAHVLAVDLSRRSMGYAKRMAEQLGIDNVSFLHGDLLDLPQLGRRFHHIDCVGVLHHLEDPLAGWRTLNEVLLPGGTLKIGLYGKVARMHVAAMRDEIRKAGVPAEAAAMKRFRNQLLTQTRYERWLDRLAAADFFFFSGFRDFLFHAIEHRFSVSEIRAIFEGLGLRFIGFEAHQLRKKYLAMFPDDPRMNSLSNWRQFEMHYAVSGALLTCWLSKPQA